MAGNHLQCLKCNAASGMIQSLKRWLLTFPRRWLCLSADANVMPTAWLGDILKLPRMVTIHHGLPAANPAVTSTVDGPPIVVFMGRLVSTKGVHILLQAVDDLRDCEFQLNIIGDGPERARLEADVRSLRLEERVVFRGYLGMDEVEQALAAGESSRHAIARWRSVWPGGSRKHVAEKGADRVRDWGIDRSHWRCRPYVSQPETRQSLARCLRRVLQSDELRGTDGRACGPACPVLILHPNAWSTTISCFIDGS